MRIRRLKSEEFASCKTCKIYRLSLYSEKTNMYPKLIPVTPIKFEHLYSPGFVILSASDLSTCFIKNPLLFYNLITLLSLVMSMNDDHARIGILIVLPLFDG